jgi:hypothetical protein
LVGYGVRFHTDDIAADVGFLKPVIRRRQRRLPHRLALRQRVVQVAVMNRAIDNASMMKAIIVAVVAAIGAGACSSNGGRLPTCRRRQRRASPTIAQARRLPGRAGASPRQSVSDQHVFLRVPRAEETALLEFFDCQLAKAVLDVLSATTSAMAPPETSDAERDAFVARCTAKASECGPTSVRRARSSDAVSARSCCASSTPAWAVVSDVQACWDRRIMTLASSRNDGSRVG